MFVDGIALATAITGACFGAAFTVELMKGRRWRAAAQAGLGCGVLLNLVTLTRGSRSEHLVVLYVGLGLAVLCAAVLAVLARGDRRHDLADVHK
jgi:hypothetical protein